MNQERLLLCGVASTNLPLIPDLELSGYAARIQPSDGAHDVVSVTALALQSAKVLFVVISVDALGFTLEVASMLRERIAQQCADKEVEICLAGTHSHSAPASMNLRACGTVNSQWLQDAGDVIVQTALQSINDLQPAEFGAATAQVPGVAINRRQSTFIDEELVLWRIAKIDGTPLAAVVNFTCHPVVYLPESRLISADYPGAVRRELAAQINAPILFLTGAAGDINPVHRGDDEAIARTAQPLAKAAAQLWYETETSKEITLRGHSSVIQLPLQDPLPRATLETFAEDDSFSARRDWALKNLHESLITTVPCAVQNMHVNGHVLAAVGCELFCSLGNRVKSTFKRNGIDSVMVAAYAGSNLGYVPDAAAYARGGYEVEMAHYYYDQPACVTPAAGEMLVSALTQGEE